MYVRTLPRGDLLPFFFFFFYLFYKPKALSPLFMTPQDTTKKRNLQTMHEYKTSC